MEVFKRSGSPSWYVDLIHPATKARVRQSLKFQGSKVQAQRRAAELQQELEAEAKQTREGHRPITVGEAVLRYVQMLEARKQASAKNQRYRMDRLFGTTHVAAPGGTLQPYRIDPAAPLHDLTPAAMETLSLARSSEGKKPQTIKHELGLLRAATRYAASLGFRTPSAMVKGEVQNPWRVPEVAKKTRYLSVEEFQRVYAYLHPGRPVNGRPLPTHLQDARQESQDLLVALAYTGGRWSEIAHLTWDQVAFTTKQITLWAGKVEKERVVPMADLLRLVLLRRLDNRTHNLVFPGPFGRPRTKPSDAIGEAMTAIGLNDPATVAKFGKATIHSLRHTFASWLIQNGADLGEVADVLGHASITTTTRYAHLSKGATLTKLGGILGKIDIGGTG